MTTLSHTAAPTGSTTLNHVRGPSAVDEIDQMCHERNLLVAKLKKLTREIADAELVLLVGA